MDRNVIIHVGMHKTASTFLQRLIFPYFNNYLLISRRLTQYCSSFNKIQFADDTLYNEKEIVDDFSHLNDKNLILSDEAFTGLTYNCSALNRSIIAKRFANIFPEAKIILFIRGQQSAILSNYRNWVDNMRGRYSLKNFVWKPIENYSICDFLNKKAEPDNLNGLYFNSNRASFHLDQLKYYNLIKLYRSLFNQVYVFLFEEFRQNQEKVISEIESIVNDKLPEYCKLDYKKKVAQTKNPKLHLSTKIENRILNSDQGLKIPRYKFWIAKSISRLVKPFLNSKNANKEIEFVNKISKGYFKKDNDLIIKDYPEIGIQNFPEDYEFST